MTTSAAPQFESRPRDTDRRTRIHLSLFDRLKFLVAFTLTFFVLVWSSMAGNPLLGFNDALIETSKTTWWIFILAGVEVIRQVHFLISEFASPYHGFWQRYFAFVDRTLHRISDWNRYRLSRAIKLLVAIALLAVILGALTVLDSPLTPVFGTASIEATPIEHTLVILQETYPDPALWADCPTAK